MAQNYSPNVIAAAVAEIQRTDQRRISYRSGQWYVYAVPGPNGLVYLPTPAPAAPADAARWNVVLDATEARLNPSPPPAQPTNWWQRVAWGNNGTPSGGSGSGSGNGGGAPGGRSVLARAGVVAATAYNIHQSGQSGEQAVTAVARGAASIVTGAFKAGADIGNAIIRGAMRPFGASGAAVAQFAEQLTQTLGKTLSSALDGLTKIAGAGGKVLGMGVGAIGAGAGAVVGGAIGLLGGGVGAVPGALIGSIVGVALMKVTQAVGEMVGGVLSAVGSALGAVGEVVASTLRAIMDVAGDLTESTLKLSRAALELSQQSGLSLSAAASANNLLAGFGVRAGSVDGLNRNTFIQSAVSRAFGVQGEQGSEGNLRSFRDKYQQIADEGPLGLLRAQMSARSMGMEALIPMANLPQNIFNRQIERSQSMQQNFGMTPEKMQEAAQNFGTLTSTISHFADIIKAKIGSEVIPFIIEKVDAGIEWVGKNSPRIVDGIKGAVSWMIDELPGIIQNGTVAFLVGAQNFLHGVATVGHGLATMLRTFEGGQGLFSSIATGAALFFDTLSEGLRNAAAMAAVVAALAHNAYELSPVGIYNAAKEGRGLQFENPVMAAAQSFADTAKYQTDFAGALQNFQNSRQVGKAADWIDRQANGVDAFADERVGGYIDTIKNLRFGKSKDGQSAVGESEIATILRGILRAVEGTEDNTESMAQRNYAEEASRGILIGRRLARARG